MHILACVAEAVVLPDGRLRGVGKSIEKMALPVSGELSDVQEAVEIRAIGERLGVAKFAHVAAIFVKNHDQVRLAQGADRHLSIG